MPSDRTVERARIVLRRLVEFDDVPEVRHLYRANRRRGYLQRYSAAAVGTTK